MCGNVLWIFASTIYVLIVVLRTIVVNNCNNNGTCTVYVMGSSHVIQFNGVCVCVCVCVYMCCEIWGVAFSTFLVHFIGYHTANSFFKMTILKILRMKSA